MNTSALRVAAMVGLLGFAGCGSEHHPEGSAARGATAAGSPSSSGSSAASGQHPARAPAQLSPQPLAVATQPSAPEFRAGEIIVKYAFDGAKAVTEDVEQWVAERRSFLTATADTSASLDGLHRALGVRGAQALLPGRYGLSTKAARMLLSQRASGAVARSARLGLPPPARSLAELANVYVLTLPPDADVAAAVELAKRDPHVEYAQPNYLVKADFTPNDPFFATSGSWGQLFDDLWGLKRINAPAAWDVTQGDGVLVAVVDTGLDLTHPDIAGNIWQNPGEVPGNGSDDDGNGLIDDVNGWNFAAGSADPADEFGHGTHVSGTIAALGNNGTGVIGVAPRATVLPVRALDATGNAAISWLAQALIYAAQSGARVINNSWGCNAGCPSNPVAEEAVDVAVALGATVVFSAGNSDHDISHFSPQNRPNVIVVAASDPADQRALFSNFGALDVTAPGSGLFDGPPEEEPHRGILSLKAATCPAAICPPELVVGGLYLRQAGTSMAAPHVAGLAALILAQHPEYTAEQVRQVIRRSAFDTDPPGYDADSGYGRIDAAAALAAPAPLSALISEPSGIVTTPGTITVTGTAAGPAFASFRLEVGEGTEPSSYTVVAASTTPVSAGTLGYWDASSLLDRTYTLRLQATTEDGAVYEDRQPLTFERLNISEPAEAFLPFKRNTLIYRAGSVITVRGTVGLGQSYDLSVSHADGSPLPGADITLANSGQAPVVDGLLGTWDTTGVPADGYQIVLTAHGAGGAAETDSVSVVVDPTLHPGWPLNPLGPYSYPNMTGGITAADLDGDGADEMAFASTDSVTFFTHTGAELPGWPQSVDPYYCYYGCWVNQTPVVADVTGDDKPEVIIANDSGELFVWAANGERLIGPAPLEARFVAVDDMDGDGVNDIVTTGFHGRVNVWHADSGELAPGFEAVLDADFVYVSPPALGDVDGDGNKEIAVTVTDWYYYTDPQLYLLGADGIRSGWPQPIDGASYLGVTPPVLGDLDGDGNLEVVTTGASGKVFAFRGDGRNLRGWPRQTIADNPANAATLGDFDGDGKLDVIAGTSPAWVEDGAYGHPEASLFAWHGNGRRIKGFPVGYGQPVGPYFFGFGASALADIDGDGQVEAITSTDGPVDPSRVLTAVKPDASIVPGFPKIMSDFGANRMYTSAVADFDGDDLLELAFIDTNGLVYLWDLDARASAPRPWPMYQHDAQHTARADVPGATAASGLRARLRGGAGSASDDRIEAQIRLLNDTGADIPLQNLTLRYWYTDETSPSSQRFALDAATNESSGASIRAERIRSTFGRVDRPDADRYVEVGFARRAGKLKAESSVALDFTIRAKSHARYEEKNDYSYRRTAHESDWKHVTVYRGGELVWGVEP